MSVAIEPVPFYTLKNGDNFMRHQVGGLQFKKQNNRFALRTELIGQGHVGFPFTNLKELVYPYTHEQLREHQETEGLHDGDPGCWHEVVGAPGGGVKCTKCRGWFCF